MMEIAELLTDVGRTKRRFASLCYRLQEARVRHMRLCGELRARQHGRRPGSGPIILPGFPIYSFARTLAGSRRMVRRPLLAGAAQSTEPQAARTAVRVLVAHPHPLARLGIVTVLQLEQNIEIVEAADAKEALTKALALHPDIILVDGVALNGDAGAATRAIKERCPKTQILALADGAGADLVGKTSEAGAGRNVVNGLTPTSLIGAMLRHKQILESARLRHSGLTAREVDVLTGLAYGLSDKEIAAKLLLSESTVKTHLKRVYRRFNLRNRAQAAVFVVKMMARSAS